MTSARESTKLNLLDGLQSVRQARGLSMRNAKRLLRRYEDDDVGDIISESPITIEHHWHGDQPQQSAPPVAIAQQQAAPVTSPRRPLWPWLVFAAVLGAAIPLLLEHLWPIGRQTVTFPAPQPVPSPAPNVIHVPSQPPPVINLPPAPEPIEPGRYFLRPGEPLDD
jgi:hypothetical protein